VKSHALIALKQGSVVCEQMIGLVYKYVLEHLIHGILSLIIELSSF